MNKQKILITGATDGIGKQTAFDLAGMDYPLVVHGKSGEKLAQLQTELQNTTGNKHVATIQADFNSLQQVGDMAEQIRKEHSDLAALINNAGVFQRSKAFSEDGYEKSFAINHLAPFKLTLSVIDLLQNNAPARVVTVSSMMHEMADIDFDNLNGEKSFQAHEVYSLAKLCNALFAFKLAEKLEGTGVTSNCLHPGVIGTKLLRAGWGGGAPLTEGSKTSVFLATSGQVANTTGHYFSNQKQANPNPIARDKQVQDKLWNISLQMTGMSNPFA